MPDGVDKRESEIIEKFRKALSIAKVRYSVKMSIYIYDNGRTIDVEIQDRERIRAFN
jgi:hypothetical protein